MKLDLETVRNITTGAVRIEKESDGIHFYRFTKEQELLYKERRELSYNRTFHTAGIRLSFCTNSETLCLKGNVLFVSCRGYYSLDVFVNGKPLGYIDNFSQEKLEKFYATAQFPFKPFEESFALGVGEKTVCIYLPWSAITVIEEILVDDKAFILPIKPEKTLLAFGDSITHGYDALRPSMRYPSKVCDALGAAEYNKAIGGEMFFPALAEAGDNLEPDYITVAYGTNDWASLSKEELEENSKAFYANLARKYPSARIFAITPIWRENAEKVTAAGAFMDVSKIICAAVKGISNINVIEGIDLVPHDTDLYADGRLHPNDEGFTHYAENLIHKIKELL